MADDAVKDFVPISLGAHALTVMMAYPSRGVKSMRGLVAPAKSKSDQINYCSNGNGTSCHLALEMYQTMTVTAIQHVAYGACAQANANLLAGHASLQLSAIPVSVPIMRSGKVVGLGVTISKRIAFAPELATLNEAIPGGAHGLERLLVTRWRPEQNHHPPALQVDSVAGAPGREGAYDGYELRGRHDDT